MNFIRTKDGRESKVWGGDENGNTTWGEVAEGDGTNDMSISRLKENNTMTINSARQYYEDGLSKPYQSVEAGQVSLLGGNLDIDGVSFVLAERNSNTTYPGNLLQVVEKLYIDEKNNVIVRGMRTVTSGSMALSFDETPKSVLGADSMISGPVQDGQYGCEN